MRRPLALFMVSCLTGMLVMTESRWGFPLALGMLVLYILYVYGFSRTNLSRMAAVLSGVAVGSGIALLVSGSMLTPALCEGTGNVYGYAYGPDYGKTGKLVLQVERVEKDGKMQDASAKILIISNEDLSGYRHKFVRYRGILSEETVPSNPNGFDYVRYGLVKGYDKVSFIDSESSIEVASESKSFDMISIKDEILGKTEDLLDETSQAYFASLVFGDTSLLEEEQSFRIGMAGLSHLFAVSGLHIAILYAFMMKLANPLFGRRKCLKYSIALLLVFAFISVIGFPVSALRAFVFIVIFSISKMTRRKYDLLNALLLAAFLILAWNPYQMFSAGFQLSFASVASIHFIYPAFDRWCKSGNIAVKVFLVSLAVQIGVAPIVIHHFNYVSIVSIAANVPAVIFLGFWLPFLYMYAFSVGLSIPLLPKAASALVDGGAGVLDAFSKIATGFPGSSFELPGMGTKGMALYYAVCAIFVLQSKKDKLLKFDRMKKAALAFLTSVLVVSLISVAGLHNEIKITFFDVGQGDCVLVRTPNDLKILVDGGKANKDIEDILIKNGVNRIDLAVLTHFHEDHYGGMVGLIEKGKIETLFVKNTAYENGNVKDEIEEGMAFLGNRVIHPEEQQMFVIDGVKIQTLNIGRKHGSSDMHVAENDDSLVILLSYKDFQMLLTGDVERETEEYLASVNGQDIDVMKASHHGSDSSNIEVFVETFDPEAVVVQVGRNVFGHPSPSVVERYMDINADLYRTDCDGAVSIVTDGMNKFNIDAYSSDRSDIYEFE